MLRPNSNSPQVRQPPRRDETGALVVMLQHAEIVVVPARKSIWWPIGTFAPGPNAGLWSAIMPGADSGEFIAPRCAWGGPGTFEAVAAGRAHRVRSGDHGPISFARRASHRPARGL